jgi:lipopolysaccharide export system ATP-binding protein
MSASETRLRDTPRQKAPSELAVLQTHSLTKSYYGRTVVRDVSVQITQGETVGLLGPNGAGKTTTFNMVVGVVPPDAGRVALNRKDITDMPMYVRARQGISYLPQEPSIFRKLTVEQNILAILESYNISRAERQRRMEELLDELGVQHCRRSLAVTLSGGERRRVEIA